MILKNLNPITLIKDKTASPVITAYLEFNHLKQLFRQGWLRQEINTEKCESVAEHIFGVAILAVLISHQYDLNIDLKKVLLMSLLHETGEIYVGDLIPQDSVTLDEKFDLEREAVLKVLNSIPNSEGFFQLWLEFEEGVTPEARFVKQLDKLEMAFQAFVYEKQYDIRLEDFYASTEFVLNDQEMKEIFKELKSLV